MKRYELTLNGISPLLMHQDNLSFGEKIRAWQLDPANKEHQVKGDDRSPAWTWCSYVYHDTKTFGIPADNLMTCFREGGTKVSTGKGKETYKKQTQSGIIIDQQQFDLQVNGHTIPVAPFNKLIGNMTFLDHVELAEAHDFELFVKRARVNKAKHVRVRPLFRDWTATGSITIVDEELSGLTRPLLERILAQCGSMCGICDWRTSSPNSSGSFGKFEYSLKKL